MAELKKEQILAEVEDLLRLAPSMQDFRNRSAENLAFFGRTIAVIGKLSLSQRSYISDRVDYIKNASVTSAEEAFFDIIVLLNTVKNELRMETIGPINTAIGHGMVFDYFEEIKNVIRIAKTDILVVDPYLSDEFVRLYLPFVQPGVVIRLLGREKMATLIPAAKLFSQQYKKRIEVRSATSLHDRYLLVDAAACYQSGASFKDGGKSASTTITQITDAFAAVRQTYEDLWQKSKIEL